jgi:hypothetical protein
MVLSVSANLTRGYLQVAGPRYKLKHNDDLGDPVRKKV